MFNFFRNCQTAFHSGCNIYIPKLCARVLISLHPHQHYSPFFKYSHHNRYEVVSHCWFDLLFLMTNDDVFHVLIGTFVYHLWRNACLSPLTVFSLDCLSFGWVLGVYILDIKPLSDIWFTNTFSHSIDCLLTFLVMSSMVSDEKTGVHLIENPFYRKSLLGIPRQSSG